MFDFLLDNPIVDKIEDLKLEVEYFLCHKPAKLWRWLVVTLIVITPLLLASFDYGGRSEAGAEAVVSRGCKLLPTSGETGAAEERAAVSLRAGSTVRILATAPAYHFLVETSDGNRGFIPQEAVKGNETAYAASPLHPEGGGKTVERRAKLRFKARIREKSAVYLVFRTEAGKEVKVYDKIDDVVFKQALGIPSFVSAGPRMTVGRLRRIVEAGPTFDEIEKQVVASYVRRSKGETVTVAGISVVDTETGRIAPKVAMTFRNDTLVAADTLGLVKRNARMLAMLPLAGWIVDNGVVRALTGEGQFRKAEWNEANDIPSGDGKSKGSAVRGILSLILSACVAVIALVLFGTWLVFLFAWFPYTVLFAGYVRVLPNGVMRALLVLAGLLMLDIVAVGLALSVNKGFWIFLAICLYFTYRVTRAFLRYSISEGRCPNCHGMYVLSEPECVDQEVEHGSELHARDVYTHTTSTSTTVTRHFRREYVQKDFRNVATQWASVCRNCGCRVIRTHHERVNE